jgi:hypothetical protein
MLYDPAWETEKNGNSSEIKKRSLLETMKLLNPMTAIELIKKYHKNRRQNKKNKE